MYILESFEKYYDFLDLPLHLIELFKGRKMSVGPYTVTR